MRLCLALLSTIVLLSSPAAHGRGTPSEPEACNTVRANAQEGDLLFIEIDNFLFRAVAETTSSWTSHVGIVLAQPNGQIGIFESTVPFAKSGDICKFVKRSKNHRVTLIRPKAPLNERDLTAMRAQAKKLLGIRYDTGFNLDSGWNNMFCSKYVHLVYEAAGRGVGRIETFRDLFNSLRAGSERDALEGFWTRWFAAGLRFSGIPWERRTITPASQLLDPDFELVLGRREI